MSGGDHHHREEGKRTTYPAMTATEPSALDLDAIEAGARTDYALHPQRVVPLPASTVLAIVAEVRRLQSSLGHAQVREDALRAAGNEWMARAEAAEDERDELRAKVAAVGEALAVVDEVAFAQIATEKMLTIMPTGRNRAAVPAHWREEAEKRASAFRQHFAAALAATTEEGQR